MLCSKCGKQLNNDAKFCDSCGSPATASEQQSSTTVQQTVPLVVPKASKPKKPWYKRWWVWVAAVFVLIIVIGTIGEDDSAPATSNTIGNATPPKQQAQTATATPNQQEQTATPSPTAGFNLSKTFTSETEGLDFNYPETWAIIDNAADGNLIVLLERSEAQFSAFLEVSRFPSSKSEVERMLSSLESEFESFSGETAKLVGISDIVLDGVAAKMMTHTDYEDDNEIYWRTYYYGIGSTLYRVQFSCAMKQSQSLGRVLDAIMESYRITRAEEASGTESNSNIADTVPIYDDSEFNSYGFAVDVPDFFPYTSYEHSNLNEHEQYDSFLETESGVVYTYQNYDLASDGAERYCALLENMGFSKTIKMDWEYYSKDNVGVSVWINEDGVESIKYVEISVFHDYPDEYWDETPITFDDLMRFPEDNKGKNVSFTGEVQQVWEQNNSIELRLATKYGEYVISGDIVYVIYDKPLTGGRILDNDIITIYGVSEGLTSYKTIHGQTITLPLIKADEIYR